MLAAVGEARLEVDFASGRRYIPTTPKAPMGGAGLRCGAVAQLGERHVRNVEVEGSSPFSSTISHQTSRYHHKNLAAVHWNPAAGAQSGDTAARLVGQGVMVSIGKGPSYLTFRRGAYYFRQRVPSDLVGVLGKRELRYSLRFARSLTAARMAAMRLAVVADYVFAQCSGDDMSELTAEQIRRLADTWFRQALESGEAKRRLTNRWDEQELEDYLETGELVLSDEREALALMDNRRAYGRVDSLLEEQGLKVSQESSSYQALCRELLKAGVRVMEIDLRRAVGDYSDEWATGGSIGRTLTAEPSISLQEALNRYVAHKESEKDWSHATKIEAMPKLERFVAHVGSDTPVNFLTPEQIRSYADAITELPGRAKGSKIGGVGMEGHYEKVRNLLNWTKDQHYGTPADLASILRISAKAKKRQVRYRPFTTEDLEAIFSIPPYAKDKIKEPSKFWVPILALYTGARLEELCQLHRDDVREIGDLWCVELDKRFEGQTIKTDAGVRVIPLHPFITEELNFLAYVRRQRKGQLWPELKRTAKGRYGASVGNWFGREKAKLGMGQEKNFHSFRRTFINYAKQHSLDTPMVKELVGHELDSDLTLGVYPDQYHVAPLFNDVISRIDYGVDLSHLKSSKWVRKR